MAVRTPFQEGGTVPDPDENVKPPKGLAKDPVEDAQRAFYDGYRLQAFAQGAGFMPGGRGQTPTPIGAPQQPPFDLSPLLKGYSDVVSTALTQLGQMVQASQDRGKDSGQTAFLQYLVGELKDMRGQIVAGGSKDPLQTLIEADANLNTLVHRWREREGLPKALNITPTDLNTIVQLEQIRLNASTEQRRYEEQMADRRHQWEVEMEERRRQWEKEDKRWEADFKLGLADRADARATREKAGDIFEDIVGALTEGIDARRAKEGGVTEAAGQTVAAEDSGVVPPGRRPKAFRCGTCHSVVQVESPEQETASCGKCGTIYDLTQGGQK